MAHDVRRNTGTPREAGDGAGFWRSHARSARDDTEGALRAYTNERAGYISDGTRRRIEPSSDRAAAEIRRNCAAGEAEADIHQGRCEMAYGGGGRDRGSHRRSADRSRQHDAWNARFTLADVALAFFVAVAVSYIVVTRTNLVIDNTPAMTIHKQIVLDPIVNGDSFLRYRAIYDKRPFCDVRSGSYEIKGRSREGADVHLRSVQPRQYGTWPVGSDREITSKVSSFAAPAVSQGTAYD